MFIDDVYVLWKGSQILHVQVKLQTPRLGFCLSLIAAANMMVKFVLHAAMTDSRR